MKKKKTPHRDPEPHNPEPRSLKTGINGLDTLLGGGIPEGSSVLVSGGTGSGKTLLCLQIAHHFAAQGKRCFYMSFEESKKRLQAHMASFGWNAQALEKQGLLQVERLSPLDIQRAIDALLMEAKGELLIDIESVMFPKKVRPQLVIVDSLNAISSAFLGKEDTYRIYIEQLFHFFERIGATALFVCGTERNPKRYSPSGVEEFLADGILVIYSFKRGGLRQSAIEVLKMRGVKHERKAVPLSISDNGIEIYPEQEVQTFTVRL